MCEITGSVFSLVSSFVGGIFASLVAIIIWERRREPQIVIEIPTKEKGKEPAIQLLGQVSRAFYHLRVKNNGKSPAYSCTIRMKFYDTHSEKELFALNGKWDRGPEPLIYTPVATELLSNGKMKIETGETRQPFLIPFAERLDIHPGMPEDFCVLVKYDNEKECYAFSSWSYIEGNGHKVSKWKLLEDRYIVETELTYSGKKSVSGKFLLTNARTEADSVEVARDRQ